MSVNALVIGDIHLSGQNLAESEIAVRDIIVESTKFKFDMIVFLGDICDKFQNVHTSVLRVMCDMVDQLKKASDAPIFFITGNHDRPNNQHYLTNEHPFHGISHLVTVVATEVVEYMIKGRKFLFVPYVPEQKFMQAIHDSGKSVDNSSCIFAHQTVKGAPLGGCVSETGDEWPESMPLVISGHIHGYCVVQPNWVYAGMAWQQHATDSTDRAIMHCVFGENGGNIKYNDEAWCTRIKLPSLPKKINVELTCDELKKFKPDKNAHTWIKLSGTSEEIQTVLKLARVRDLKTVHITVNRIVERDLYIESTKTQSFRAIVESAISDSHPHLMEHHKTIMSMV